MIPAVKFVDGDTTETRIEGLLMPFGGPFKMAGKPDGQDLYGEHFTPDTDFCLDWYKGGVRPILYGHGLDSETSTVPVGWFDDLTVKADLGGWMQGQLDAQNEYYGGIKDLIKAGKLFLSSGAMAHLVDVDHKSGAIKRWPVVEGSLTPTPANLLATVDVATAQRHFDMAGIKTTFPKPLAVVKASLHESLPAVKSAMDGSYEELIEDLNELLNPMSPFGGSDCYSYVLATFPGYAYVSRCEQDSGDCTYWRVAYTVDALGEPVLGEAVQQEQTYVPVTVAKAVTVPISIHAKSITRLAAGLAERTKGLSERRIKEGRVLSDSNRQKIAACCDTMAASLKELQGLLDSTVPQTAKAAIVRRLQDAELLTLWAATLPN
jgi:hypothetical protein